MRPISLSDPKARIKIWRLTLRRDHNLPPGTVVEMPVENKTLGGVTQVALGDIALPR
ncbi:hypothetical protein [Verrucomicrobium spinosum]|uniref:hypothetical protein n=1 Tax=Verrucomicrobium spinosum TaxID=2736 RepID=UPI0001745010|nr:hypothetical protein [Verrucomicrobium spinosum]